MTVYEKVTRDKYELPLAVADSERELARILGISVSAVSHGLKKYRAGKKSIYHEVEIEGTLETNYKRIRKPAARKKAMPKEIPAPEERPKKDEWQKVIMCFKNI